MDYSSKPASSHHKRRIKQSLCRSEDDFGPPALAVLITEEAAKDLARKHREEVYEEMFGEEH